jgi:hypothetical protein
LPKAGLNWSIPARHRAAIAVAGRIRQLILGFALSAIGANNASLAKVMPPAARIRPVESDTLAIILNARKLIQERKLTDLRSEDNSSQEYRKVNKMLLFHS